MTKTESIIRKLKRRILSGEFHPGEKLPSMRDLSTAYGVSTMVLRKAVEQLEKEGLVESSTRSGMFIPENLRQHELCGVISSVQMGTMDNYFEAMLQAASDHNCVPMIVPPILSSIESMLEKDPRRVFVSVSSKTLSLDTVREIAKGREVVYCGAYEWVEGVPETGVLADWVTITEKTLKAFLKAGHKRILFISYNKVLPEFKRRQFQEAGKRVGLEFDTPEFQWVSISDVEKNPDRLAEIFRESAAPTAAFARGDSLLYNLKKRLEHDLPEYADMDFIGAYNSFWSNYPEEGFASWEWDWNELWERCFQRKKRGVEYYMPTLVKWSPKKR